MTKVKNKIFLVMLLALALCCPLCALSKTTTFAYEVGAKGACLLDASTNQILYSKNADAPLPMASTTKILTAIIVIENCDLNKTVKVPSEATKMEGSSIYLKSGEEIKTIDLLYGLMLRSGNDSAVALAISCAGSVENFASLMNEKAKSIGAVNSSFKNPHGLDDKEHFTTAKDLALITSYALKNPTFKQIVSTKMHKVEKTNLSDVRYFKNKNKMLSSYEGAIGVKTGFTKKCGRCLVSAAERDGKTLVAVVINCPNMWQDSKNLLDFGFETLNKKQ